MDITSSIEDLRAALAREPLLDAEPILSAAMPAIRLKAEICDWEDLSLGDSRFGGLPDVPADFVWPTWKPDDWEPSAPSLFDHFRWLAGMGTKPKHFADGQPLDFLAQIDLSTLPAIDPLLPSEGWLYFFYDREEQPWGYLPSHRDGHRVIFSNAPRSSLQRALPPDGLSVNWEENLCRVEAITELSLPDSMPNEKHGPWGPKDEAFYNFFERVTKVHGTSVHRIWGHPIPVQGPVEDEFEEMFQKATNPDRKRSADTQSRPDWRLLLQLDSDDDGPSWMWDDAGSLYFGIRREDLEARRFDRTCMILQCS